MKKNITAHFIFFSVLSALLGGFFGAYLVANQLESRLMDHSNQSVAAPEKVIYVEESQVVNAVKSVSPSVVSIVISKNIPQYRQGILPFGDSLFNPDISQRDENGNIIQDRVQVGGGSGFIISEEGLIVTNRHVVNDEEAEYTVMMNDGREFSVEVLGRDRLSDFAVLKLIASDENPLENLPFVTLGNSDALEIGQKVVAIGNALAEYQNTVTTGVVSGVNRNIMAGSMQSSESLVNLIQTDAAINPGNSGGPLVNLNGEVIAINTAIAADGEGIGFAIPINDVRRLIETVEESGKITHPFLGVRFMMLDPSEAKALQIDVEGGALLVGDESVGEFAVIPGGPGDEAGLQIKDVILEVDGEKVDLNNPLHMLLARKKPGDEVALNVWRSGEVIEVSVRLDESE